MAAHTCYKRGMTVSMTCGQCGQDLPLEDERGP